MTPSATALHTTQIILEALHPQQTPSRWESDFVRGEVDWDDLAVRAIVLGLAPQLHSRLQAWDLRPPARAVAKLAVTYRAQVQRTQAIYHQLGEFLDSCASRDLYPIALKGIHLAACYYADPNTRPMNDIDLLFRPEELPAVEEALRASGYDGRYKSAEMGAGVTKHVSTFRRRDSTEGATSNPYLSADSDRTIEPHTSLEESWFGLKVDITPGIRRYIETVDLQGHSCPVLLPEELLIHVSLHFCFHLIQGAPALVQLTDLLTITQSGRIDWDRFQERAAAYQVAPYAYAGLSLAQQLLAAPVPPGTIEALNRQTPVVLRNYIEKLTLTDVLRRTQQKPLTTLPQRILRGFRDRAETARWAQDWQGRLNVWRTLLQPGSTDTGQLILRKLKR